MLPSPLHPAVVHFPIVLAFLLPLATMGALWAIRRGRPARSSWALPVALAAGLAAGSWAAVETGEQDEDRAEDTLGEPPIHAHEEAGERFLLLAGVVLVVSGAGLLEGPVGRGSRLLATIGAIALPVAGYQVGHSGGRLVYGDAASPGLVGSAGAGVERRDGSPIPVSSEREHD